MNALRPLLLAATALAASPALASTLPAPCAAGGDPRVRCADYQPHGVIVLVAEVGGSLLIEMPEGERVIAVPTSDNSVMRGAGPSARLVAAHEDDEAPAATQDRSLAVAVRSPTVIIKPNTALVPQPLFIITERDGRQTRYRFELRTAAAGGDGYYSLKLRNPEAEAAERRARAQAQVAQRQERTARERLQQAEAAPCASIANVNRRYVGQGDAALAPAEICDDGRTTWMRFPGVQRISDFKMTLPGGQLASVQISMGQGGWLSLHGTASLIQLEDSGRKLCIINHGYSATGTNTGTGTISPDVVRSPRAAQ